MMQIDCEVNNAHFLQLPQSIIPEHLKDHIRPRGHSNEQNNGFNNNTTNFTHKYKPYFVNREKYTKKSIDQNNKVPPLINN